MQSEPEIEDIQIVEAVNQVENNACQQQSSDANNSLVEDKKSSDRVQTKSSDRVQITVNSIVGLDEEQS